MPAVLTVAICIALDNDSLGVVVTALAKNATQGFERRMMTGDQRLGAFIGSEARPALPARAECQRRIDTPLDGYKKRLRLRNISAVSVLLPLGVCILLLHLSDLRLRTIPPGYLGGQ